MKKPKVKGNKPKTPKPKSSRQKQKQQQNVNVKIHIDQSKKTKVRGSGGGGGGGGGGAKMIPSYQPQPISSYPLFREEPPQLPIIRNQVSSIGTISVQEEEAQTHIRPQFTSPRRPRMVSAREEDTQSVSSEGAGLDTLLRNNSSPLDKWKLDKSVNKQGSVFGYENILYKHTRQ